VTALSQSGLYRKLVSTAESRPDAPAITFCGPGTRAEVLYSFGRLHDTAAELGSRLKPVISDRSSPIGLLLSSQEDQVLHYLAALSIGVIPGILTPPNRKLNRSYYAQTMKEVLHRSGFGTIITDVAGLESQAHTLKPYTFDVVSGGVPKTASSDQALSVPFIQFSSGTTGIKRGVLVPDEAVLAQLEVYGAAIGLEESDCIVSWLPLYHDMGFIACLNLPLAFGAHTVMIDPIDWVSNPALYMQIVSKYSGSLSWHPNFAYAFMAERIRAADLDGVDVSSLRALVNCSEPVTYKSQQLFLRRFEEWGLRNDVFKGCYAMAETTFALTHGNSNDPASLDHVGPTDGTVTGASPNVSVGQPLPGVELRIVRTNDLEELPDREVGEILVRSPFNFSGYYNDATTTRRAVVAGWYRTGDLGYRVGDQFFVVGRLKDVLIVAGVNVFPQDIEELVSQIDGVLPGRVSAFASFDNRLQTEHVVVLAESEDHESEIGKLMVREIRQRVLAAFQIGNFEVLLLPPGWLVKSTSGKMARGANHDKWLEQSAMSRPE